MRDLRPYPSTRVGGDAGAMATTLAALPYDDCLRRLDEARVGRVAVTTRALPAIVPVNFTRSGTTLYFRTEHDGMLAHACDGTVVAFEIDGVDPDGRAGWSVLVIGTAALVDGSAELRAVETGLASALSDARDQFVAITIGRVTGRQVVPLPDTAAS